MHIKFCMNMCMCIYFLLFHQLADDDSLIIILQTSLFLFFPYTVDNCMPLSSKSSLTLSIHLFLCLPLLLSPLTCPSSAAFGSLFPSILSTCPNHVSCHIRRTKSRYKRCLVESTRPFVDCSSH